MDYRQTIEYLYDQLPVFQKEGGSAYKEGLDNSLKLDEILGYPHKKYRTIHIAGTNGKGSTSHLLASVLQESGYRTGLYTSPHLVDFRERIRVNGMMIEKEYVVNFVKNIQPSITEIQPSFFELTMMMAFSYFEKEKVDVAVIEVGLGGRLDSTNIISPDLSVITNISFDHMQFLGNTLPKIAAEKAGIIKSGIPVIIGEAEDPEVRKVFRDKAEEIGTNIIFAEDMPQILDSKSEGDHLVLQAIDYPNLICGLPGHYQKKNANTVLTAIRILKDQYYTIPQQAVRSGFEQVQTLTGLSGRWQIIKTHPQIICDTGHNEAGIRYIVNQLKSEKYSVLRIVFGMVNDKDISNVIKLLPKDAVYYFTKASIPRALNENELQKIGEKENLKGKSFPTVSDAVTAAEQDASENDLIFIGGSTFIVADALDLYNKKTE